MLTSGTLSVSAGMFGSLPASSRCRSGWCECSAMISSDGTGSSSRSSGSTVVASDGSGSRSSCSTAGSVSNWRAGSACSSASGSFPTERPLRSKTYRWSYGWGHTSSCENESSSTCGKSSTGSPSREANDQGNYESPCIWGILDVHQLLRSQAGAGVRRGILEARYIPQRQVVLFEELGPSCLSWCQRSRTCPETSKTFVVSVHVHLLRSSK